MKLNTIKEMMRAGDLREAEAALREYLKADAGSTRAKVLLGVCLHLQGDEEGASRIDRQLADGGETCAAVGKFHALKVAAMQQVGARIANLCDDGVGGDGRRRFGQSVGRGGPW